MPARNPDFAGIHAALQRIVAKYENRGLHASPKTPGSYILTGPPTPRSQGKAVWFGGVQTRKNYVSFHLMPVYVFPELLRGMSPALKKRMQGKSCFNFTKVDVALFAELARLTAAGYVRFKKEKLIL